MIVMEHFEEAIKFLNGLPTGTGEGYVRAIAREEIDEEAMTAALVAMANTTGSRLGADSEYLRGALDGLLLGVRAARAAATAEPTGRVSPLRRRRHRR